MPERSVTIVHLSDLQFGKFHRFPEDADPANSFDALLPRLAADFAYLREEHQVIPDLLVVTGDLAEWGRKSELQQVFAFIAGAAEALQLPRSRVAVIPGNHDIDRKACASYFFDCESREIAPVRPYSAKWVHFKTFFAELYERVSGVSFTDAEPWTLYEYPELHTVIAGLNSTWMDSHLDEDHYGWIGEDQLRWFESRLRERQREGWLRIAALHHNVRRAPIADDENLRDAHPFTTILGPLVNVVLHGHTHDGKADILRKNVPIYSTGSAAVAGAQRPPEVPNQYQILQISPRRVRRWARAYRADERKFIGDNRASEKGDDWRTDEEFAFANVEALIEDEESAADAELPTFDFPLFQSGNRIQFANRADDLLTRIDRVCHVRHPDSAQTVLYRGASDPIPYVGVAVRDGPVTTHYPIGAAENGVTPELVQTFAGTIHARYRRSDHSVESLIVYGGDQPVDEALRRDATRLGVTLQSWVEFQGLIDFGPYLETQRRQLERDPRYDPQLYVPQKIRYATPAGIVEHEDALEAMLDMMTEREGRFVVILGEFGTGKSFLQRQLALRLSEMPRPQPILIEMRTLEKAHDFDQLMAQHLVRNGFRSLNVPALRYMLEQGRVALLFDGFDELAMRVSYDKAADHLQTLIQAAAGQAKIVVTSRTEYFESDQQVKTALAERLEVIGGRRLVHLQRFDRPRILSYLTKQLGDANAAEQRMKLLDDVEDLSGLSENARMLTFISSLDEEQLRKAKTREGKVTRSSVYRTLVVEKWLTFEEERLAPRGAAPPLTVKERFEAVLVLARHMWGKPDASVKLSELSERIADTVGRLPRIDATAATHQVASGTLLVRDAEGNFSFVHRSILEWLVATDAAAEIRDGRTPNALMVGDISPLVADFIEEEVDADTLLTWVRNAMGTEGSDSVLRRNALVLFNRLSGEQQESIAGSERMLLAGADLRGRDFSYTMMTEADLEGADLAETMLIGANLRYANLRNANLRSADLALANLSGADLSGADLTLARLRGANLLGTNFIGAKLYRADLISASIDQSTFEELDAFGAAGPQSKDLRPVFDDGVLPRSLAFNPHGDLLAALQLRSIRLFDVDTGRELAPYLAPDHCTLTCIAWTADGRHLLAGSEEGEVLLWDAATTALRWRKWADKVAVLAVREVGETVVAVTKTTVWTLQTNDGRFGRADFKKLPSQAVAADIEPQQGSVAVVFKDGRIADFIADRLSYWSTSVPAHRSLAISAADRIAAFSTAKTFHVVSPEKGISSRELNSVHGWITINIDRSLVACTDGDRVILSSTDDSTLLQTPGIWGRAAVFNPANEQLAVADQGSVIHILDTTNGSALKQFSGSSTRVTAIHMESDSLVRLMARSGALFVADLTAGTLRGIDDPLRDYKHRRISWANATLYLTPGRQPTVMSRSMTLSRAVDIPYETEFAAIASDGTVAFAESNRVIVLPQNGKKRIIDLAGIELLQFAPMSPLLIAGDKYGKLHTVDLRTGRIGQSWHQRSFIRSMTISSQGEIARLAEEKIQLLHLPNFTDLHEFSLSGAASLAYSATGKLLGIAGDGGLTIRESSSGSLRQLAASHDYHHVSFSPSERYVAGASRNGIIDVYDVDSLALIVSVGLTADGWVAFTPDGRFKSSGDLEGRFGHTINLCRYEPDELDPWLNTTLRVPDHQPLLEG